MSVPGVDGAAKDAAQKMDAAMREAVLAGLRQAYALQTIVIKEAEITQLDIRDMAFQIENGHITPQEAMVQLGGPHPQNWFPSPLRLVTTWQCIKAAREGGLDAIAALGLDVDRFFRVDPGLVERIEDVHWGAA